MKKSIAIIISMIMIICNCMVVFGAATVNIGGTTGGDIGSLTGNLADTPVTATYSGSSSKVYRVDVTWGDMKFTYSLGTGGKWDPSKHEYTQGTGGGWNAVTDGDSNKIIVANHSNAKVKVTYSFSHNAEDSTFDNITGSFTANGTFSNSDSKYIGNLISAEGTEFENPPTQNALLSLDGVPTKTFSSEEFSAPTVGKVTVTIADGDAS